MGGLSEMMPTPSSMIMGVGGAVADAASSAYNNRMAERRQHQAQDFSAQQFATRYQTTVRDLQQAGLNPMLAYQQGGGSPPSSSAASSSAKMDLGRAFSEARLASAQAAKTEAETVSERWSWRVSAQTEKKISEEIEKIQKEIDEIDQNISKSMYSEAESKRRAQLLIREKELTEWKIQLAKQEKNIKQPEEIASGTQAAQVAAHIERGLSPLIKAVKEYFPKRSFQ